MTYRLETGLGDGGGDPPRRIAPLAGTAAAAGGVSGLTASDSDPPDGSETHAPPPSRPRRHRRTAATILGGCTTAASSPAGPTSVPSPRRIRRAAGRLPAGDVGLRRARRRPRGRPAGRSAAHRASSPAAASQLVQLPVGVPTSASWGSLATTTVSGGRTIVADAAIADGGGSTATIDGAWAPPTIGDDPTPTGLSADGKTLVLIPAGDPDPARTDVALRDRAVPADRGRAGARATGRRAARRPRLRRDLAGRPDPLRRPAPRRPSGGYQVRAVDLPAGTMRPEIITDKRNLGEAMAGWPLAQLRSPERHGPDALPRHRPPVHPRPEHRRRVGRLHRPARRRKRDRRRRLGPRGVDRLGSLYAVNATRGLAVDVDPEQLIARRTRDARDRGRPDVRAREVRSRRRRAGRAARRGDDRRVVRLRGRRRRRAPPGAGPERRPPAAAGPEAWRRSGCCRTAGRSSRSTPTGPFRPSTPRPARSSARSRATATTGSSRSCPGSDRAARRVTVGPGRRAE